MEKVEHVFARYVAGRAFGVRAAAEAGDRAVESRDTHLERRVGVGQRLSISIVEVPRLLGNGNGLADRRDELPGLARRAGSDRISERDFVAAHAFKCGCDVADALRRNLTLVRTAQYAGNIAAYAHPMRPGRIGHRPRALEALGDRAVDVLARERFRRGDENGDLVATRGECGL